MITITSTPEFRSCEADQADIIIVRYEPAPETPGKFIQFIRRPLKVFGFISTAAWLAAALAPNTLNIPQNFRPWAFVIFIFWFFGFCVGVFNV